jgi:REP element-mobilizing transposase RayT
MFSLIEIRDRRRYLHWVFVTKKRFGLTILNYTVTSNNIHLLVKGTGRKFLPQRMQLIAGRTAQEYNQRNERHAFLIPYSRSSTTDAAVRCRLHGLALASCPK